MRYLDPVSQSRVRFFSWVYSKLSYSFPYCDAVARTKIGEFLTWKGDRESVTVFFGKDGTLDYSYVNSSLGVSLYEENFDLDAAHDLLELLRSHLASRVALCHRLLRSKSHVFCHVAQAGKGPTCLQS